MPKRKGSKKKGEGWFSRPAADCDVCGKEAGEVGKEEEHLKACLTDGERGSKECLLLRVEDQRWGKHALTRVLVSGKPA